MRKILGILMVCILAAAGIVTAYAVNSVTEEVNAQLRPDLKIVIDGNQCSFKNSEGKVIYPILYKGTTYLPLRAIGEIMGKNVNWDELSKTVTLSGEKTPSLNAAFDTSSLKNENINIQIRKDFKIVIDENTCSFKDVNGDAVYPVLYQGSTYLPIRAIGEIMGKAVNWDNNSRTVTLGKQELTVTDADSFNTVSDSKTDQNTDNNNQTVANKNTFGITKAKEIVSEKLGIPVSKMKFTKEKAEIDDGRKIYELEFVYAGIEYEMEIDAATGELLKYDAEKADKHASVSYIGEEKAVDIALKKISGADRTNSAIGIELDTDDKTPIYEGKIIFNNIKYEFEINALNGTIIEWEIDD